MKLFSIVRTFNKKQWTKFLTYVQLYYGPNTNVIGVLNYMDYKSNWRLSDIEELNADTLRTELPFKLGRQSLYNILVKLGNLAEEYLGWTVWKESENMKKSCQLTGLARKSLNDQYINSQNEVLEGKEENVISLWEEHYKMRTFFNNYYYQINHSNDYYKEAFSNLLTSFINSTAAIGQFLMIELRNREKLLAETWQNEEDFLKLLYNNDTQIKTICDKLINMNFNEDNGAYNSLNEIIWSENLNNYSKLFQYSIITYCILFLNGRIKKGEMFRAKELLDLYEFSFEKGIFILNEKMNITKFINIIGVSSKLEKYDWARMIVDKWATKVDSSNVRFINKLGHATIDFHEGNYEKVVNAFSKVKTTNFNQREKSRWLLLKAQYIVNFEYIELLKVQIDNFRRFIISNESLISKSSYEGLHASLAIMNMILDKKHIKDIKDYYSSSENIFERKWILKIMKNPMR